MSLYVERCGNPDGPSLVLLHGWGMHSGVWNTLLPLLDQQFDLYLIDLPGLGRSAECLPQTYSMQAVCELISEKIPDQSILFGWSLGGSVAMSLARDFPNKVSKVITLASNPCFVQRPDWQSAMPETVYQPFESALVENAQKTLQRFNMLQTQGGADARSDLKQLKVLMYEVTPSDKALQDSLVLLRGDYRALYSATDRPCLHLLCEADTVVPVETAQALRVLQPGAQITVLEGQSHIPLLSSAGVVAEPIVEWLK